MKIALVGAESTGKSTLAGELATRLRRDGRTVAVVPEHLREWCEREGRAPHPQEHLAIAREHERRVDAAAAGADVVIADTTALLVAIYGGLLFPDHPLLRFALERQRHYDATLLAGLDLPWVDDGLQRDAASRERVDELLRTLLAQARVSYSVAYGRGEERLRHALAALPAHIVSPSARPQSPQRAWVWQCDKCSDPECEHRLFASLPRG